MPEEHELFSILDKVSKKQQENFAVIILEDFPEKYHKLILKWLNGEITPNQAVILAKKEEGKK